MIEKVREVIEKEIKPILAFEGGSIELVSMEDGVVKVRLGGHMCRMLDEPINPGKFR